MPDDIDATEGDPQPDTPTVDLAPAPPKPAAPPPVPLFIIRASDPGATRALEMLEPVLGNTPALVAARQSFATWHRAQST